MHKTPEITRLIHENFWVVISFAFARPHLLDLIAAQSDRNELKFLRKTVHELAEIRADRALLAMGTQLRVLDDEQDIARIEQNRSFGEVFHSDGTVTDLNFREMTNKIIHAASFGWDLDDRNAPKVICLPVEHEKEKWGWDRAEINLVLVASFMGSLMY